MIEKFSERVKSLRIQKGLTQNQLAALAGLSPRGYQHYELGERKPQIDAAIAIADALDVSLDYLVGRSDDPTCH